MTKFISKTWLLITISIFAICGALFASNFATAEEPTTTYEATGSIHENGTTTPLEGVKVDAFSGIYDIETPDPFCTVFTDINGEFTIQNIAAGETMTLQFYYENTHASSSTYAGNRIYVDKPIVSNLDLDAYTPSLDLTLHKYTKKVSGSVKDVETGEPISNVNIDFYNPRGLASPFAELTLTTDANGNFDLSTVIDSNGVASNAEYYLVTTYQKPSLQNAAYDNYTSQTINDLVFKVDTPTVVNFGLSKQTTIQLLDREQGEETFFEQWKHKVYINDEFIDEGILGDSKLTVMGNFEFKIVQDCTMELKYYVGNDLHKETFEPVRYKSEKGWIPVYPLNNVKALYWKLWEGSYDSQQIDCYQNFEYQWQKKTGYLFMDVNYVEAAPMELSFDDSLHGYFHITQTIGDETYTYDTTELFQHNFFDGSTISVDDENNLIVDSEVGQSNALQHTVITEVPVEGAKFLHWKLNDEIFKSHSDPYIVQANQTVNIKGCFHLDPDLPAQTGDENMPLIIALALILGLAIIGLISYFVVKKVQDKKTKNRKH